jgi:hypothetical protein
MDERHPPRRILRSVGAVLAGFFATFILSIATDVVLHAIGVFPASGQPMSNALFALATAYRTIYTVAGGYITARLAPDRPMAHVWALAIIGLVAALAGTMATWSAGPEFGPRSRYLLSGRAANLRGAPQPRTRFYRKRMRAKES